jgi:signal transduction histidine kinase
MQKILVIDDEEIFRQTTAGALRRKGFETYEAGDGVAGCELAQRLLPDLILCDVNMERLDGYATLERLRQEPATATIPFILVTGQHDLAGMRQGMTLGADDYLHKPFTAQELFGAVNARLQKQQALRQNAEKKLAELRASISLALPHEMVTPLNGIVGCASLLQSSAALPAGEIAELGRTILESAERLHRLVKNFLLYSQLELLGTDAAGRAALRQKQTAGLRDLVATRAEHLAGQAGRDADLQLQLDDGAVAAPEELVIKCVDELVDNALKFSRAGSPVSVQTFFAEAHWVCSVSDHGVGMDPEQLAGSGAYTQFERRAREQQGAGLGLAIVRHAAELLGGQVRIHSQKDVGTTVTVRLPVPATGG